MYLNVFKVGDEIIALPSNEKAEVKGILDAGKEVTESSRGHAVTISLDREVDVSRGCVLVHNAKPKTGNLFTAKILWMDDTHLVAGKNYLLKLGTKMIPAVVMNISIRLMLIQGMKYMQMLFIRMKSQPVILQFLIRLFLRNSKTIMH